MSVLQLKKNEDRRLRLGHPWIYSNEVDTTATPLTAFKPGEQVQVLAHGGKVLGMAYVNPHSLIAARVFNREEHPLDRSLLVHRLNIALSLRERLFPTPHYRVVHGEADGLPGLVVDRYGDILVAQLTTAGMDAVREAVVEALVKVFKPAGVLLRNDSSSRELEGLARGVELAYGDVPQQVESLFLCGVTEVFAPTAPEILTHYLTNRDTERVGPHGQHIHGKQVLLVEDSTTVAFVVRKTLLGHGLMVDWERSAEDALDAFKHKKYDLLITDLVLEGEMSGVALVSHLRQSGYNDFALPILAMTGFDERSRRRELFRLGVNDYVVKPVLEEELIVRTRNLIIANRLAIRVEAQHARIKVLESSDALTGVYNRRMLFNMSEKYLATARRTEGVFSLVLVEMRGVDDVVAQYGINAADEVLSDCARAMRLVARSSDIVARVGDARFAVALPYCAAMDVPGVGERYRRVLSSQKPFGMPLGVSVGAASLDIARDSDFDHLFTRALRALERDVASVPA